VKNAGARIVTPAARSCCRQRGLYSTTVKSSSGSKGFETTSIAPRDRAILRKSVFPTRPPPEMAMIFASGSALRISVMVWMLSSSCMTISVMTRSGCSLRLSPERGEAG
jgi:hypothetical protein